MHAGDLRKIKRFLYFAFNMEEITFMKWGNDCEKRWEREQVGMGDSTFRGKGACEAHEGSDTHRLIDKSLW